MIDLTHFLRDYQHRAKNSVWDYFRTHRTGNPLIAMPTGTGKSRVIAGGIIDAVIPFPKTRTMVLTHSKELVDQNFGTLLHAWPQAPAGVYSAGLKRYDIGRPITFGGIQSVWKNPAHFGHIDLLWIDEAHTIQEGEKGMYGDFIGAMLDINPLMRGIGLTATPFRIGQGMLTDPGGLFDEMCCDLSGLEEFNKFLDEGYLCPLIPRDTDTRIDLSGVGMQNGDFNLRELQAATDKDEITRAACAEMRDLGHDRNHWLIFAAGVANCHHVAECLNNMGISARVVHSNTKDFKMSQGERDKNIADFKAGRFRALVNNGVLTTGFDFPGIDMIGMLRATTSPGLWVQMLGRGTRPLWPSGGFVDTIEGRLYAIANSRKRNCLVLDFAGNSERLGPINDPKIPKRRGTKKEAGVAPSKVCPACGVWNHAQARLCFNCGREFPVSVKFGTEASTAELIRGKRESIAPETHDLDVGTVTYRVHRYKDQRPAAFVATYHCGLRAFEEWVSPQGTGSALIAAKTWFAERTQGVGFPEDAQEMLSRIAFFRKPKQIRVWTNHKPPRVLGASF